MVVDQEAGSWSFGSFIIGLNGQFVLNFEVCSLALLFSFDCS